MVLERLEIEIFECWGKTGEVKLWDIVDCCQF